MDVRAIGVLVLISAAVASPQQPTPPVFRSGVDAVRIDVLVTRGGRPVPGLTAKDFEVLDDGVPQQVKFIDVGAVPINLILDVDVSESVAGERLRSLIAAGRAAIGALRPIDRAALLSFSHQIIERVPLTGNRDQLVAGISGLSGAGNTSLYDAAYAGLLLGDVSESRTLLLVFSDGRDTSSWLKPSTVLDAARRSAAIVYAVTPQPSIENRAQVFMRSPYFKPPPRRLEARPEPPVFLDQITTLTGGRLLTPDQLALANRFVDIVEEFQNRYVLAYVPTDMSRRGWHTISVRVPHNDVDIKSRRAYWR